MRRTTLLNALAFPLLVLFSLSICSQTNSSNEPQNVLHSDQTLRTNTRLVVVDVVATDNTKLNCTVWAYGKDKRKPVMSGRTVNANLPEAEFKQMQQQRFLPCSRELELKPGTYALRMGVLDRTNNKMGTTSAQVTVP